MDCIYKAPFLVLETTQSDFKYKPPSPIHTHIHTPVAETSIQGAKCSSGQIQMHTHSHTVGTAIGSDLQFSIVRAPRTLRHVACRCERSNPQVTDWWRTCLLPEPQMLIYLVNHMLTEALLHALRHNLFPKVNTDMPADTTPSIICKPQAL